MEPNRSPLLRGRVLGPPPPPKVGIRIDEESHRIAKIEAAKKGWTLEAWIGWVIRQAATE